MNGRAGSSEIAQNEPKTVLRPSEGQTGPLRRLLPSESFHIQALTPNSPDPTNHHQTH